MIRLLLIGMILGFIVMCYCSYQKGPRIWYTRGVSLSTPPWCPTNVNCDEYMKEQVHKSLLRYVRQIEANALKHYLHEEYVVQSILATKKHFDKDYLDEFARVLRVEFRAMKPKIEIAQRENLKLDVYIG